MYGLDLFSGIGGLSKALQEWVRPIAYCEIDPYCQGVLLSRIADGQLAVAPIWDDIRSFSGKYFVDSIDIIYGGFPCQDISVAGRGKGLEGERSGLFFEIIRLAKEVQPQFLFLENVPAITSRGGLRVVREIAKMGYDCRWCTISATSIGALHIRERWFLLGYSKHNGSHESQERGSIKTSIYSCEKGENETSKFERTDTSSVLADESMANSMRERGQQERKSSPCNESEDERWTEKDDNKPKCSGEDVANSNPSICNGLPIGEKEKSAKFRCYSEYATIDEWQEAVSSICRVTDGIPNRVDRIKSLGNAVVSEQAKEAFKILMGYNERRR